MNQIMSIILLLTFMFFPASSVDTSGNDTNSKVDDRRMMMLEVKKEAEDYYSEGDYYHAVRNYQWLIDYEPQNPQYYFRLCFASRMSVGEQVALLFGRRGLELIGWTPGVPINDVEEGLAIKIMAQIYSSYEEYENAVVYWDALWEYVSNPYSYHMDIELEIFVLYFRAEAYQKTGDDHTARAIVEYVINNEIYENWYKQIKAYRIRGDSRTYYYEKIMTMYETYHLIP